MKITALEEYGLRCILQLAQCQTRGPITIGKIAKREGLSMKYVAKLMWRLRKSGLIQSVRGAAGGYVLTKGPEQITLADILVALDGGPVDKTLCHSYPGNLPSCTHLSGCGVRPVWFTLANFVHQVAKSTTLSQLMGEESQVRRDIEQLIKKSAQAIGSEGLMHGA